MNDIEKDLREVGDLVRNNINAILHEGHGREQVVAEAMRYMLLSESKMLRPFLVMKVNAMFGSNHNANPNSNSALDAATAIEMIHTYTLIHDDLPAMDDDDYRRGRLSCHKKYGEAMAILAGDAILTLAFQILANACVNDVKMLGLIKDVAELIGYKGLIAGQALDMIAKEQKLDYQELKKMKILKTSNLFIAACRCAAVINDAPPEEIQALDNYARCFGLAYQIKDDIEDEEKDGSESMLHDVVNESLNYLDIFGNKAMVLRNFTKHLFKIKQA
jgi:geranylgeranyl pyrophosphate synthase